MGPKVNRTRNLRSVQCTHLVAYVRRSLAEIAATPSFPPFVSCTASLSLFIHLFVFRLCSLLYLRLCRSLRCFKDAIPAAVATAFGEHPPATTPHGASMQPPLPQSPQFWATSTTRSSTARTPAHVPPWLTMVLGSSVPSPATPLLVSVSCRGMDLSKIWRYNDEWKEQGCNLEL